MTSTRRTYGLPALLCSATNRTTHGIQFNRGGAPPALRPGGRVFARRCIGSCGCVSSPRRVDYGRPHLQVQDDRQQLQLWLGDGSHRGIDRAGHGFSNPFGPQIGPTAWEPPLYPYLVAGVFHIFGTYSTASAFVLLSVNSLFSALTCIPIFLIARRIFSERVAVGSAWAWALLPNVMFWCTRAVWETSLAALLLATIFWLALTMEDRDGWRPWIQFGLLWGITALSSTSLLSFLPASGLWAWYRRAKCGKRSVSGVVFASVIFFACMSPWLVRNYQTFGEFIFIRDNFGAELRLGNGPGADGTLMLYLDATHDAYAMRQFRAMGELPYIAMRKRQALDYIEADYVRFTRLCVKRFIYFWCGPPRDTQPWWLSPAKNAPLPALIRSYAFGTRARCAAGRSGCMATRLAHPVLSGDVLRCIRDPTLSTPHRAGRCGLGCLCDY